MQRTLPLLVLVSLGVPACLPPPADAGQVDSSGASGDGTLDADGSGGGSTAADSGDGETDQAPPAASDVDWSFEVDPRGRIYNMIRSPDGNGVVLVIQGEDFDDPGATLRQYGADMEVVWSRPVAPARIHDLDFLGGNDYLLAGVQVLDDGDYPAVWRQSCCEPLDNVMTQLSSTPSDILTSAEAAEPLAGGVLVAVDELNTTSTLLQAPLELTPFTSLGTQPFYVEEDAPTASGSVLLLVQQEGAHALYEVEADGTGTLTELDGRATIVGAGDDLVVLTLGDEVLGIHSYGGGAEVPVAVPGLEVQPGRYRADRRERFAFAYEQTEPDGTSVRVVEFDEAGTVLRELDLPRQRYAYGRPTAVAVGEDDAIYVATSENNEGTLHSTFLHRIAPL